MCTFSRPYFIGPGSVRHHQVPVSAIPCLHQKRLIKEIEKNAAASANAVESVLNETKTDNGDDVDNQAKVVIAKLQAPGVKVQVSGISKKIWKLFVHNLLKILRRILKILDGERLPWTTVGCEGTPWVRFEDISLQKNTGISIINNCFNYFD